MSLGIKSPTMKNKKQQTNNREPRTKDWHPRIKTHQEAIQVKEENFLKWKIFSKTWKSYDFRKIYFSICKKNNLNENHRLNILFVRNDAVSKPISKCQHRILSSVFPFNLPFEIASDFDNICFQKAETKGFQTVQKSLKSDTILSKKGEFGKENIQNDLCANWANRSYAKKKMWNLNGNRQKSLKS